jgi:ankyrin repeat protein
VDTRSKEGLTGLAYACVNGKLAATETLLLAGANANIRLHDDDTILMSVQIRATRRSLDS